MSTPVGVREVAARAGVSVGTVSNVLNRPEKVAPATLARVLAIVDDLGFVRNDAARQLRLGHSRSIGLVVLDVRNPFFTDIARGAEHRAAEQNYAVLLGNSDEDEVREAAYLDLFHEQRVRGLLVTPRSEDHARLARIQHSGTPVVLVDHKAPQDAFSSVSVDDVTGGYIAVKHLLGIGRRRITFLGGPMNMRQVKDRRDGALRAVAEHPEATLEVVTCEALTVLHGRSAGEQIRTRAKASRPDAIFAANDLLAVGVLQAMGMSGGVRVPDDIALIGYDDIDFSQSAVVPLSSIRQPAELIGSTAVELLFDTTIQQVVFQPELVVRASTMV